MLLWEGVGVNLSLADCGRLVLQYFVQFSTNLNLNYKLTNFQIFFNLRLEWIQKNSTHLTDLGDNHGDKELQNFSDSFDFYETGLM